jgi:hypothetical protein
MEAQKDKPRVPMKSRSGSSMAENLAKGVDFENYEI